MAEILSGFEPEESEQAGMPTEQDRQAKEVTSETAAVTAAEAKSEAGEDTELEAEQPAAAEVVDPQAKAVEEAQQRIKEEEIKKRETRDAARIKELEEQIAQMDEEASAGNAEGGGGFMDDIFGGGNSGGETGGNRTSARAMRNQSVPQAGFGTFQAFANDMDLFNRK